MASAVFRTFARAYPECSYEWYEVNPNDADAPYFMNVQTRVLTITDVSGDDNGRQFFCRISNSEGTVDTDPATLTVLTPDPACPLGQTYYYNNCTTPWALDEHQEGCVSAWGPDGYSWHFTHTDWATNIFNGDESEVLATWTSAPGATLEVSMHIGHLETGHENGEYAVPRLILTFARQGIGLQLSAGSDIGGAEAPYHTQINLGDITYIVENGAIDGKNVKARLTEQDGGLGMYDAELLLDDVLVASGEVFIHPLAPKEVYLIAGNRSSTVWTTPSRIRNIMVVGTGLPNNCTGS